MAEVVTSQLHRVIHNGLKLYATENENNADLLARAINEIGLDRLSNIFANTLTSKVKSLEMKAERTPNKVLPQSTVVKFNEKIQYVRQHAERKQYRGWYAKYWRTIVNMTDEEIYGLIAGCYSGTTESVLQIIYKRIKDGSIKESE